MKRVIKNIFIKTKSEKIDIYDFGMLKQNNNY